MMEHNETAALITINRYKEALKRSVQQFNGEIIQYFGDGGLIIFLTRQTQ
jgi:class 3 adenylate cyclase